MVYAGQSEGLKCLRWIKKAKKKIRSKVYIIKALPLKKLL